MALVVPLPFCSAAVARFIATAACSFRERSAPVAKPVTFSSAKNPWASINVKGLRARTKKSKKGKGSRRGKGGASGS